MLLFVEFILKNSIIPIYLNDEMLLKCETYCCFHLYLYGGVEVHVIGGNCLPKSIKTPPKNKPIDEETNTATYLYTPPKYRGSSANKDPTPVHSAVSGVRVSRQVISTTLTCNHQVYQHLSGVSSEQRSYFHDSDLQVCHQISYFEMNRKI
ncbi:unnamed protein product [Vicia faba]|uniref:Uncharacterized protein n=1 Tax=Vicia faba TaxID=3906 RepID=A0AAV0YWT2_VICFA|nr:unnamed protein product [Vicia faba]